MKNTFREQEDKNLFTQKFCMLNYALEDVSRYGNLNLVDTTAYEHFNVIIKKYIRMTSMREESTFEETAKIINSSFEESETAIFNAEGKRGAVLGRDWTKITLHVLILESCVGIDHLTHDARKALQAYIMEANLDTNTESDVNPIPLHVSLIIFEIWDNNRGWDGDAAGL